MAKHYLVDKTDVSIITKNTLKLSGLIILFNVVILTIISLYTYYQKTTQSLEILLREHTHVAYRHLTNLINSEENRIITLHNQFLDAIDMQHLEDLQKEYFSDNRYPETLFFVYRSKSPINSKTPPPTDLDAYTLVFNGIEKLISNGNISAIEKEIFPQKKYVLDIGEIFASLITPKEISPEDSTESEFSHYPISVHIQYLYLDKNKTWYTICVSEHTYTVRNKTGIVEKYKEYLITVSSVFNQKIKEELSQYRITNRYGYILFYIVVMNEDGSFSYHYISDIKTQILEENPDIIRAIKEERDLYRYKLGGKDKTLYSIPFDKIKTYIVGVLVRDSVIMDFMYDIVPVLLFNVISQSTIILLILKYIYDYKSKLKQITEKNNVLLCACDGECIKIDTLYKHSLRKIIDYIKTLKDYDKPPLSSILAKIHIVAHMEWDKQKTPPSEDT